MGDRKDKTIYLAGSSGWEWGVLFAVKSGGPTEYL